jgi:hypothetical protein
MKRVGVIIGLGLALGLGSGAVAQASSGHHHPVAKKKCKANWVFRKGKCRRVAGPYYPPPDNSPRDIVRATLTWQGNANLDLIVTDEQDRVAGYLSSAAGVVNEIPDATHEGDVTGGGTETFVDHVWHPNPFLARNRGFFFGACARDVVQPVTATLAFVRAFGGTETLSVHFDPPDTSGITSASTLCLAYYG